MAVTNFSLLTDEQKTTWSMELWEQARNYSFINKFMGKDTNSVIQHVDELTKTEKGNRCVLTLLADLEGDGTAGDRTLEGNEEAMKSYDQVIRFDQLRHANRHEGRMADQKSVVRFRENSRDRLAYWLADRLDQLAFLTLSGRAYTLANNGTTRVGSDLANLEFAADVAAPTNKRVFRWDASTGLVENGTTAALESADTPTWELFVNLKAKAKDQYMRGIKTGGGEEVYHCFLTPQAMAKLKLDDTYMLNVRHAKDRGDNELFSGSSVKIDGIVFHEFRHVFNTSGLASGSKWGSDTGSTTDGCQILFCGAQALGMADIGTAIWTEKGFDYDNQQGIAIAKMAGFLKPKFNSIYAGNTVQDFGVMSVYVAQ